MRSNSFRIWLQVAIAALLIQTAFVVRAQAADEAGVVIVVSGAFVAERADGTTHTLQRRSKFFVGDVLRLSEVGRAQIRFHDGTILSLASGTDLKVDAFRWSESAPADEVANIVTLLKGGFRTITGAVSKRNRDAYRVNTPVATIGVRGTHYSVVLSSDLFVGVWEGGVTLTNDTGSLDLGLDVAYRYGQVSADQSFQGLVEAPAVLIETMDPVGTDPGATAQSDGAAENEADASEQASAGADGSMADAGDGVAESSGDLSVATADGEAGSFSDATTTAVTSTTQPLTPVIQPTVPVAADARLTDVETASLTKGGFVLFGGVGANGSYGGKASDGAAGDPLFADNGLYPGAAEFDTRLADAVVRRGSAGTNPTVSYASFGATMGDWSGTTTNPVTVQTDATDASILTSYSSTAFWLTFDYTSLSALQGLSGQAQYRNLVDFKAGASHGSVSDFFMTTDVDFATGTVGGGMSIYTTGGDIWQVDYDGSIQGAALNLSIDALDSKLSTAVDGDMVVTGEIKMAFAGASGDGLAGYFDVQSATTGSVSGTLHDVDGIFLLDNTPVGDRRLTTTESASIDRLGFAAIGGPVGGLFDGSASAGGANGDPILVSKELDIDGNYPAAVLRSGTATLNAPTTLAFGTKQVEWGEWNADLTNQAHRYTSADDPLQKELVMDRVYWLTVEPTDPSVLSALASNNKTGTWTGTLSPSQFSGVNAGGSPIASMSFDATIQFGTGAVTGAAMSATVMPDTWNVNFNDSTLAGGVLNLTANPTTSTISGLGLTDNTVSGGLRGAITGDAGDTIAASFSLRSNEDPNINLNGAFAKTGTISP